MPLSSASEVPPLPTNYASNTIPKLSSSDDNETVPKDAKTVATLSVLINTLKEWVQGCLVNVPSCPEKSNFTDFKDFVKKEFNHGKDILKEFVKRVDILLEAANSLLDPETVFLHELGERKNLIRDGLNDAGLKIRNKLERLTIETTEYYDRFVSACHHYSEAKTDEFVVLKVEIVEIFNIFVSILESVIMLQFEIQKLRGKIKKCCSEIETIL